MKDFVKERDCTLAIVAVSCGGGGVVCHVQMYQSVLLKLVTNLMFPDIEVKNVTVYVLNIKYFQAGQ